MRQLHLHVISQDFDSKHFKNKKHWNSFNSPFFRDSEDVIREVSEQGKPILNDDVKFTSMELRCNRCKSAHPNIPRLKSHIAICKSPFPANLLQNGRLLYAKDEAICKSPFQELVVVVFIKPVAAVGFFETELTQLDCERSEVLSLQIFRRTVSRHGNSGHEVCRHLTRHHQTNLNKSPPPGHEV